MSTGPKRGTEEYTGLLERRVKEQRDHIKSLTELREEAGTRKARKRIEHLERSLGRAQLKIDLQKRAIAYLRDRLLEHNDEPVQRAKVKVHVP